MTRLAHQRILLGVSGGIAAYKTPELVRRLKDEGADVHVVLTAGGARFVSALALEVVSGHAVGQDLWAPASDSSIVHTDLGKHCDLILLAPATANLIGRVRAGLADDLLTTAVMACQTPVLICPSMNTEMLSNPLVRENLDALAGLGRYTVIDPDAGQLACGVIGAGRLPDPPAIIEACAALLAPRERPLDSVRATVSAGPTREALDPVRFLSNRSTGTMGFALAAALGELGAEVTLVAGPVERPTPAGVARRVDVVTAADLAAAVASAWEKTDILVMAAAVADWRPAQVQEHKLKKGTGGAGMTLEMERTEDVLLMASRRTGREHKLLVGFAAETRDLEAAGRAKLAAKDLDLLVANDVSEDGVGFGPGDNAGIVLSRDGSATPLDRMPKAAFARAVAGQIAARWEALRGD